MKELYDVDELKLYFGDDFVVNEHITIHQPTIGQIIDMKEQNYYAMVYMLTAIPSDMIAQLDSVGVDWNKVQPFELFSMLVRSLDAKDTKIFFGDLDFSKFEIVPIEGEHRHVLHHKDLNFDIDELMYGAISRYICLMHGIKKKPKFAANEATRQMMIEMAQEDMERAKKKPYQSQLKPLISSLVNSPGFKYDINQIRDMKLCAFYDSVSRIRVMSASLALLQGLYSGNVDMKKLDKTELDFMRSIA